MIDVDFSMSLLVLKSMTFSNIKNIESATFLIKQSY